MRLTREQIKEVAEQIANDLTILASNNNTTVQQLFDNLDAKLKKMPSLKHLSETEPLSIESPT
jgi:hypothetical protein